MPTEICWRTSASASCFHAVAALAAGDALVDRSIAEALLPSATELQTLMLNSGASADELLRHLVPLSARIANNTELAQVALTKTIGRDASARLAPALSRQIAQAEAAYERVQPGVAEELALRAEPLKGQWEAHGPGLLSALARLTDEGLAVEQADVVLVQPVLGGGGVAHLPYNLVRIEAVLANPLPELPESVRLAWLIAQLNLERPGYQGELPRQRVEVIGPLALLPAILRAAQEIEILRPVEGTTAMAVQFWRAAKPSSNPAATLCEWWDTYCSSRPPWAVALGALDRMLGQPAV